MFMQTESSDLTEDPIDFNLFNLSIDKLIFFHLSPVRDT